MKTFENIFQTSNLLKTVRLILTTVFIVSISACQVGSEPRLRPGAFFGSPTGIYFPDPNDMGRQQYKKSPAEKNGLVYTCRGGFIDIGHLRESADRTKYISKIIFSKIMKGKKQFSFRVIEPARYLVTIDYPDNWDNLTKKEKEKIAKDFSINCGFCFAQTSTIWHEIITWFGFTSTGIFSEHISSFSWEDTYSDLLGASLAAQALRDTERQYNDAMTMLIQEELRNLDIQPPEIAKEAVKKCKGKWYTGELYFFVTMNKRNFDVGMDDGFITPWLIPDFCPDSEPKLCQAPDYNNLSCNGFSVDLEIQPTELEKNKILRIIYPKGNGRNIKPCDHFPIIMDYIVDNAKKRYGPEVNVPTL